MTPLLRSLTSRLLNAVRLVGRPAHVARVRRSREILSTLRAFRGDGAAGRAFAYLRSIEAHTFEEVVLTALEEAGCIVLRNRRYTADGGVDGRVLVPGDPLATFIVQSKRYSQAVSPAHVGDFIDVVRREGHSGGLFVHCGRTGPLTKLATSDSEVSLVSGSALLNLLLRSQVPPFRRHCHAESTRAQSASQRRENGRRAGRGLASLHGH